MKFNYIINLPDISNSQAYLDSILLIYKFLTFDILRHLEIKMNTDLGFFEEENESIILEL